GGDDGYRPVFGSKDLADTGPSQLALSFLLCPFGRLRQEGPDDDERNRGHDSEDESVAPGGVDPVDGRQRRSIGDSEVIAARGDQASDGAKGLRIAENILALFGILKDFREPGDGGDEFDAESDECGATQEEQFWKRGNESRGECRDCIKQDAEDE